MGESWCTGDRDGLLVGVTGCTFDTAAGMPALATSGACLALSQCHHGCDLQLRC